MLGVLIFSSRNELLHFNGNSEFHFQLLKNSEFTIPPPNVCASTSSGVYSESLCSEQVGETVKRKTGCIVGNRFSELDKYLLTQAFLPLITLYRANAEAFHDSYEEIESGDVKILLNAAEDSSLVVTISRTLAKRKKQRELSEMVRRLVGFFYGPLLDYAGTELSSVKLSKKHFDKILQQIVDVFDLSTTLPSRELIANMLLEVDCRNSILLSRGVRKNLTALQRISGFMQTFIGDNRCLLLAEGKVLCCTGVLENEHSSEGIEELTFVNEIAHMENGSKCGKKLRSDTSVVQVWMKRGQRSRSLSNVFQVSLPDNVVLMLVTSAEYSAILDGIGDLLKKVRLDYICSDLLGTIREVESSIFQLCAALTDILGDPCNHDIGFDMNDTTFLKNINRTTDFLKSLWHMIKGEFIELSNKIRSDPSYSKQISPQISLNALKRKLLSRICGSAVVSKNSRSEVCIYVRDMVNLKLESMIAHFRRQLRSIMQELCCKSLYNAKNFRFALFESAVEKALSRYPIDMPCLVLPSPALRDSVIRSLFRPALYALDMSAYTYVNYFRRVRLSFVPDDLRFTERAACFDAIAKAYDGVQLCLGGATDNKYLLVRITKTAKENRSRRSFLNSLLPNRCATSLKHDLCSYQCTAIFEGAVNFELAWKQTQKLATTLNHLTKESVISFR